MNTQEAAANYIAAKDAYEAASAAKERAKSALLEAYAAAGIDSTVVDGTKVAATSVVNRSIDVESLEGLVSRPIFDLVTRRVVNLSTFDAAVTAGRIKSDVADSVTTLSPTIRVTVNQISANAKAESKNRKESAA